MSGLVTFTRNQYKYGRALCFMSCGFCITNISCSLTLKERRNADIFVRISKGFWQNGSHLFGFQIVVLPDFRSHLKCRRFATQPLFDHSKSRLVQISDPHCVCYAWINALKIDNFVLPTLGRFTLAKLPKSNILNLLLHFIFFATTLTGLPGRTLGIKVFLHKIA